VNDAARDAASDFRLNRLERGCSVGLLARGNRRFDLLDEGPDTADSRLVDGRAVRVSADAILGLRRVRHEILFGALELNEKAAQSQTAAPTRPFP
jgi:hypothetical protein